jgi:transcriptional regulator with XRE-family HTH domain
MTQQTRGSPAAVGALGRRITHARADRGWSQQRLAEVAGISPNTVSSIERGRSAQHAKIVAVCEALGLDATDSEPSGQSGGQSFAPDVQLIVDAVGLLLQSVEPCERPAMAVRLFAAMYGSTPVIPLA